MVEADAVGGCAERQGHRARVCQPHGRLGNASGWWLGCNGGQRPTRAAQRPGARSHRARRRLRRYSVAEGYPWCVDAPGRNLLLAGRGDLLPLLPPLRVVRWQRPAGRRALRRGGTDLLTEVADKRQLVLVPADGALDLLRL